jgi:hypothetical protein
VSSILICSSSISFSIYSIAFSFSSISLSFSSFFFCLSNYVAFDINDFATDRWDSLSPLFDFEKMLAFVRDLDF